MAEADKLSGLGGERETGLVAEDMVREEEDAKMGLRKSSGKKAN